MAWTSTVKGNLCWGGLEGGSGHGAKNPSQSRWTIQGGKILRGSGTRCVEVGGAMIGGHVLKEGAIIEAMLL